MEDKKLSPQESMALISQMIEATKQRIAMPDLRISVLWATLSIVSATIVLVVSLVSYNPLINLVWFAIPVIGIPANILMARKSGTSKGAKTVIDTISDKIWKSVGLIAILLTIACIIFNLLGYPQAWLTMFFYAFIVVGFGTAMTGIILKENSYVFGGIFSIIVGFVITAMSICGKPLLIVWVLPLYMVCFLLMFIVPAFIIRKKIIAAKR